ncbi:MAG: glutamine ABC transporter substrate-binding protein GlnH [Acetanaerobacterium sp.]
MRKATRLFCALIAAVLLLGVAAGCSNKTERLVVGTDTSYMPFEYLDADTNEYVGFDIDLMKEIAAIVGFEYELKPMDFNGLLTALQTKQLDIAIAGITIKDDRKEMADFSTPYYDAGLYIMVQEGNTDIQGVDDLAGKIVATKTGTSAYDYITESITGIGELKHFPNIDQAFMELQKGACDAVIFDSPNLLYYANNEGKGNVKVVGDLMYGNQFGIALRKDEDPELLADINDALATLTENGKYDELYMKWFGTTPPAK